MKNKMRLFSLIFLLLSNCLIEANTLCSDCVETDECCWYNDLKIHGDYLFWETCQDGLDIAGVGSTYPGRIKSIEFDWTSGFRVGIGKDFCNNWSLDVDYTWLRTKGSERVSGDLIFPTFIPQFSGTSLIFPSGSDIEFAIAETLFNNAKGKLLFNYDVIDVDFSRIVFCTPCFELGYLFGAQGGFFKEDLKVDYRGNLQVCSEIVGMDVTEETIPFTLNAKQKWRFKGGGLKFGFNGRLLSGSCLFLYSDAALAILYGKYKNVYKQTPTLHDTPTLPTFPILFSEYYSILGKENFCDFLMNVDLNVGLGWTSCTCWGNLTFQAGWEMVNWFNLAQFRKGLTGQAVVINVTGSPSDLDTSYAGNNLTEKITRNVALQGIVISISLQF